MPFGRLVNQRLKFSVDLKNRFALDSLDVWHGQTIWTVNRNGEVVVLLDHISLDETILIEVVVDLAVHQGVLIHGNGAGLDEERKHRQFRVHHFQLFPQGDQGRRINLV